MIAVLPTPGFGIFAGMLLGLIFKSLHKPAILMAFPIWNPVVLSPVYLLSQKVGELVFGTSEVLAANAGWIQKAIFYSKTFLFGNFIFAVIISAASYWVLLRAVNFIKAQKLRKSEKIKAKQIQKNINTTLTQEAKFNWPQSNSQALSA